MKIIFILLLLICFSCSYFEIYNTSIWNFDYTEIDIDFSKCKNNNEKILKIEKWVIKKIKYEKEQKEGTISKFKSPAETLKDKSGDCEDLCILIAGIAYRILNIKMQLVCVVNEKDQEHMIVSYNNIKYYKNKKYNIVSYIIPFEDIEIYVKTYRI